MLAERRHDLVLLTEAAIAVALSVLLGNIRLLELPNGGSIALAVLPLLSLSIARGPAVGLLAGCCAGMAHALAGGTIIHPAQLGLDYLVAYAVLAVAGIGVGRRSGISRARLVAPITLAMLLHLAAMVASGVIFFAPVAGGAALAYSLAYNAATVAPETLLALWLVPPLVRSLARANPADAWRRGLLPPPRLSPRTARPLRASAPRVATPAAHVTSDASSASAAPWRRSSHARFVRSAPFTPREHLGEPRLAARPTDRRSQHLGMDEVRDVDGEAIITRPDEDRSVGRRHPFPVRAENTGPPVG